MVFIRTNDTSFADFNGHGAGYDIAGGKILGSVGVALHKSFTFRVEEVTTLTAGAFGDQTAGAVDASGVELDEFQILVGETGAGDHGHTIACTGVGGCATEVCASVASRGQDCVVRAKAVECAIFLVVRDDTLALTIFHNQVQGEVLDKVVGVVSEGLAVESV